MSEESSVTTFGDFVELIDALSACSSHKEKSKIVSLFLYQGSMSGSLHPEAVIILKLLLPSTQNRVYNIKDRSFISYFSEIFDVSKVDMMKDLEEGDISATLCKFYQKSAVMKPASRSKVLLSEVDKWLDNLSCTSGDTSRKDLLRKYAKLCTLDEFVIFIRLIKKDLRISSGAKQILDGLDPNAYAAFQTSRDLNLVVDKLRQRGTSSSGPGSSDKKLKLSRPLSISIRLMTPVLPMLAEAGRSVEAVIDKGQANGGGLIAEIKYDGERLQVHKDGTNFAYFSRSLKPVPANKVQHLRDYIPQAFPTASSLVIDSEILLLDTQSKKPLPFGTLGVHKRAAFKNATVCLFVFDCLYIDGKSLLNEPVRKRREILEKHMTIVPDRVLISEKHEVQTRDELNQLMARVFAEGLEGLVLKPLDGIYEPGKRHWIKIKKDYLGEGAMADSADLIVLGAYFGTGNKGGLMSVFLMGAYDAVRKQYCTVTKCGNGLDDRTLHSMQKKFKMVKISKDFTKVPNWLNVSRSLVPDFVVEDPKKSQVWEITGTEFTRAGDHTAGTDLNSKGISIRFPRVTRIRTDKSWKEATDVERLKTLLQSSLSFSDWFDKLDNISKVPRKRTNASAASSEGNAGGSTPSKKPRLTRIPPIESNFKHLRSIFDGFVISAPAEVVVRSDFSLLRRRLIACGADVISSGDADAEKCTHVILTEDQQQQPTSTKFGVTSVTVAWLYQSLERSKLMPLPIIST